MKYLALTLFLLILAVFWLLLDSIDTHLRRSNELQEQELVIREMEAIATFCQSKSGSIDYGKKSLECDGVRSRLEPGTNVVEL